MPDGIGISPDGRPSQPQASPQEAIRAIAAQTELTRPLPPQTVRMGSSQSGPRLGEAMNLRGEVLGKPLSPRQAEILRLAGHGLTDQQIADKLGVGRQNIKNQASETIKKLGVFTTIDAIDRGIEMGILDRSELEKDMDAGRLAQLTQGERRSYLLIVNAGEDEGFKELAYQANISYQTLKNDAVNIWRKLGITRRQARLYQNLAVRKKIQDPAFNLGEVDPNTINVFDGIPLPNENLRPNELTLEELQILSLSAYGLTRIEVAEILERSISGIKKNIAGSILPKMEAKSIVDATVKAISRGDLVAEEIIPDGIQLRINGLSPINKRVLDAIVDNPDSTYEDLAPQFGVMEKSLRFRTQQIMHRLGVYSKDHMIIVMKSLKIAEERSSDVEGIREIA